MKTFSAQLRELADNVDGAVLVGGCIVIYKDKLEFLGIVNGCLGPDRDDSKVILDCMSSFYKKVMVKHADVSVVN